MQTKPLALFAAFGCGAALLAGCGGPANATCSDYLDADQDKRGEIVTEVLKEQGVDISGLAGGPKTSSTKLLLDQVCKVTPGDMKIKDLTER